MEPYPNRLFRELAFHGNAAEKLVNRGLIAIAQRMELPLVAQTAVRFARPDDALAHKVLEAIGSGARADGILGHNGRDGFDLPTLTQGPRGRVFDARFAARERPGYPHPAMAGVLDKTFVQVLYAVI